MGRPRKPFDEREAQVVGEGYRLYRFGARYERKHGLSAEHIDLPESFMAFAGPVECPMAIVLCNDGEIEVPDGEICQICGQELEEFDEVTGTGIHGYYHWICVNHVDA
jgi:hypothetical protein